MTYTEFVKRYRKGELSVQINKTRAGDFVLSEFADKHNKPAHYFWSWTGTIVTVLAPIVLLLIFSWKWALLSFIIGIIIVKATSKSASQFVLNNMLEDETFYSYVLIHDGVRITEVSQE